MRSSRGLFWKTVIGGISLLLTAATRPTARAVAQEAGAPSLEAVIEIGEVAPGARGGATVQMIGDAPAIDADGNVALVALVREEGSTSRQAILRKRDDRVEVVFEVGDAAPGLAATFAAFPGLPFTPSIDGGRLFITATVQGAPGTSPRAGLWSDRFGVFQPLALQGDALPGMPPGAGLADWDVATRMQGSVVLLRGRFSEGASINPDSRGLWRNSAGEWEVLVARGLPAPGLNDARFSGSPIGPFGPIFAYGIDGAGRVATQSWIAGRRIDEDNDEGIWVETGSGLSLLVREGARVAGKGKVTFGPSLVTFGGHGGNVPVVMNAHGVMAFGAVLRTAREVVNSIWTTRTGVPERLVSGGMPLVGAGEGDLAPGLSPGARFASFLGVALNDARVIAFQGFADEFGDVSRLTEGIWWDAPGSLALAVATRHPAPMLPSVTILSVRLEALDSDGSLLVSAGLIGGTVTHESDRVLYRFGAEGTPSVLLREGQEVDVIASSGQVTRRILATFRLGSGRALDGTRVVDATFTDGSGGVYVLRS